MPSPLAEAFLMGSLNSCYETPSKIMLVVLTTKERLPFDLGMYLPIV